MGRKNPLAEILGQSMDEETQPLDERDLLEDEARRSPEPPVVVPRAPAK